MTAPQRAWVFLERMRDAATVASSAIVISAALYAMFVFFTGGLKPASQVNIDGLQRGLSSVQIDVGDIKRALQEMPRPSDYAAQEQHLGRLDGRTDTLGDRITADEIKAAAIAARVDRLEAGTNTPVRQPR